MAPNPLPDVTAYLLGQGALGVAVVLLVWAVIALFKKLDAARDAQIAQAAANAVLATTIAEALKTANTNATAFIEAMQTYKLLSEMERKKTA